MSTDYAEYERYSTPVTLTIQGDAGGFQVALEAHVEDHSKIDENLDKMRRSFIRQRAHMDLTLVLKDLTEKHQELRDAPVIIEATEKSYVVQHAEMVASFQNAWSTSNKFGEYKPSTSERENLKVLRAKRDERVAQIKAGMETIPLIIRQLEERAANLRKMIAGTDRHDIMEAYYAEETRGHERLPSAAE